MKFRLPRKTKKKIKRGFFLYPPDEEGNSLMANPETSQKEYDLYLSGYFKNLNVISKKNRKEYRKKIFSPVEMSDNDLKIAVDYIFAKEYRLSSYRILLEAKKHNKGKEYYYAFINAYNLTINGDEHGNTCCMAVDSAKEEVKKTKRK